MNTSLFLQDQASLSDLQGFLTRAKRLDQDGAVRLKSFGDVLAITVAPIYGTSIIGNDPTVLGMRIQQLAQPAQVDVVVAIASILERLASGNLELPIPPKRVVVPWSGISPPQSGWQLLGQLSESEITAANSSGIEEVAQAIPENLGAQLVQKIRAESWGKPFSEFSLPKGVAFAASGLGFVTKGGALNVFSAGNWRRISSDFGHVLVRG